MNAESLPQGDVGIIVDVFRQLLLQDWLRNIVNHLFPPIISVKIQQSLLPDQKLPLEYHSRRQDPCAHMESFQSSPLRDWGES